jgi:hypothetical protein
MRPCAGACSGFDREGSKQFFFEKKHQKTFIRYLEYWVNETNNSFLVLFFKKELLSLLKLNSRRASRWRRE